MILVLLVHFFGKYLLDIAFKTLLGAFSIWTSQGEGVGTNVDLKALHNAIFMKSMPTPVQKARLALVQIDVADLT